MFAAGAPLFMCVAHWPHCLAQTGDRLQGVVRTVIEATLALSADEWAPPPEGQEASPDASAARERMAKVFSR